MAEASTFPFTIEEMDEEEVSRRRARGLVKAEKLVRVEPGGVLLYREYRRLANLYYTFQFRSDDILLMAYPKSGTIWGMEILWALRNVDHLKTADAVHIWERIYFLDLDFLLPKRPGDSSVHSEKFRRACPDGVEGDGVEDNTLVMKLAAAHQGSPRILATHLPFALLPQSLVDTCKVVYVVRNPKDVCFSYFNFFSLVGIMAGELRDITELFMAGSLPYGSYWEHLHQVWQRREHPNVHILSYENMKADFPKELKRLSDFLQVDVSDEQLASVAEHTSLEKMRAREKTHPVMKYGKKGSFFHGGRVGAWADNAPEDLDAQMDKWIREESSRLGISDFHSTYAQNL